MPPTEPVGIGARLQRRTRTEAHSDPEPRSVPAGTPWGAAWIIGATCGHLLWIAWRPGEPAPVTITCPTCRRPAGVRSATVTGAGDIPPAAVAGST
jgi:hypothetical protein